MLVKLERKKNQVFSAGISTGKSRTISSNNSSHYTNYTPEINQEKNISVRNRDKTNTDII